MGPIEIIGLIASILSIFAAIWSFLSAKSSNSAKNEVLSKLKVSKYSEFNNSSKNLLTTIRKFANKSALPRGINIVETSDKLNEFYEELNNIKHEFDEESKINSHLELFKEKLSELSSIDPKTNTKKYLSKMNEVYYIILDIDADIIKHKKQILER